MMKNNVTVFALLLWVFCLSGCGTKEKALPVVDFTKTDSVVDLNLNSLVDDVRIVRLETSEQLLLPGYTRFWVGEKHIIAFTQDAIYQFDRTGKYVRKLAVRGNGPDEFQSVSCFAVDEMRDRLYYNPVVRDQIMMIDLKDGHVAERYQAEFGRPDAMAVDEIGSLICSPSQYGTNKYVVYALNSDGKFLYGLEADTAGRESPLRMIPVYLGTLKNGVIYKDYVSDTLCSLNRQIRLPLCFMKVENPLYGNKQTGSVIFIQCATDRGMLVKVADMKILRDGDLLRGVMMNGLHAYQYYWVDIGWETIQKAGRLYIEALDLYVDKLAKMNSSGENVFLVFEALDIKNKAAEKRAAGETLSGQLEELDRQLKEDDNHVLIIGSVK